MLPSEMVSGPDTGGGFLFQLTIEPGGEAPGVTFHAQEGGEDAGGPPRGSPEPLGYRHPAQTCMFGGPRCWHRRFRLGRESLGRARAAYNRTRFTFSVQIAQAAGLAPVPIADGLRELVATVAGPLTAAGIPWLVGGSAGAWLLGMPVAPNDIDLATDRAGAEKLAELLEPYLVEPWAPSQVTAAAGPWGARAFLGTAVTGVRVEWASIPATPPPDAPRSEFSDPAALQAAVRARWEGLEIPVARPEFPIARWLRRGDEPRLAATESFGASHGVDLERLRGLLPTGPLPDVSVRWLARLDAARRASGS